MRDIVAGQRVDLRYPGGKGGAGVYHQIIRRMPPHGLYVEPFLGRGAVMRHKRPAAVNVGIDADRDVVSWWRVHLHRWPQLAPRLDVIRGNALDVLTSYLTLVDRQTLIYVDPPYLRETRTRLFYAHEFETPALHTALLKLLLKLSDRGAMVMLSGYPSKLYTTTLKRWQLHTYRSTTRGGPRLECLWFNFPPPTLLHDARYAGKDFRDRQRLKRKATRWRRRLASMDPLERQVIAEALADVDGRGPQRQK
jgi:16S rRNA G966 N2-methylase RsmD